jgi:hypothetical protein
MSEVNVTIGANSQQLQSEFENVKQSAKGLKKGLEDVDSVFAGNRKVESKLHRWVDGMKEAQNGADVLSNTMSNLGDVFKQSLALAVGLNLGAVMVGMFSSAITECDNLKKSAEATGAAIKDALASKDSGNIASAMKAADEEMKKLKEHMNSWKPTLAPVEGMDANLFQGRVDLANEFIVLMKQQNEIQSLINQGQIEEAELLAEKYRLEREIAAIRKKGFPTKTQEDEAVRETEKAGAGRVEAIKNKPIKEAKDQAFKESSDKRDKEFAQQQKDIAAEQEAVEHFNEWKAEQEATARAEREKGEKESAASIASFYVEEEKKKWQAILDEATKQRKAIDDADKLRLEGNKQMLKEQEGIVKKGEQEQKQRDDRAVKGLLGGENMVAQRVNDRAVEMARDKAAGIAARDEVRRAAGGDALKMSKEDIAAVKARILGEKQLDKKKIEDAIANIPKIEAEIAKLVAKLGVK